MAHQPAHVPRDPLYWLVLPVVTFVSLSAVLEAPLGRWNQPLHLPCVVFFSYGEVSRGMHSLS